MDETEKAFLKKVFSDSDSKRDFGDCDEPTGAFPKDTPLAMAYVPFQSWEEPYDLQTSLSRGTIFPSLDKPFIGEEAF
jgi:hypothetical protein